MITQISFGKLEHGMEMPHLLDIQTRAFESLLQLDAAAHDHGTSVLVVTHDQRTLDLFDTIYEMEDGALRDYVPEAA